MGLLNTEGKCSSGPSYVLVVMFGLLKEAGTAD